MSRPMVWWFGVWAAPVAWLTVTGPAAAQVTFEWVTVPGPCNPADPLNSGTFPDIGTVCYSYRIAKHKVTNAQYAAFLNAVAADDPSNLFNPQMDSHALGGVIRGGSPASYTYSVKPGMGDRAVNFVSGLDAMRFVNWLQNGQPIGAQGLNTTEGGNYATPDARTEREWGGGFYIPSEDEWYKAAYHQPAAAGGDSDDYWLYASGSNSGPPAPGGTSYYGTVGQNDGLEWTDTLIIPDLPRRVARGFANSTNQNQFTPDFESPGVNFRVASRVAGSADFDLDLDVDLRDYQHFQNEMGGPE